MNERKAPLENITVIDMTRVLAGPYLTMMLADMGARVIKVEMPGRGDDARHFGPFLEGESAYFATINRGKESISLDLKDSEDLKVLEKLLVKADILVENFRAGTLDRLGYDWDKLQKINPKLICAAISGFGQTGPYSDRPAYDLVVQGMGGVMSLTGSEDSEKPVRVGTSIGDITAGMFGLSGVLAALYDREITGKGVKVDVGMLDCQVAILENAVSRYFAENVVPGPLGLRHPSITPFAGLRAKDDEYIILAAGNDGMFKNLCAVLNRPDMSSDPRFSTNEDRTNNYQALYEELEKSLTEKSVTDWLELLQAAGIPCGPINNIEQIVNDPHIQSRNMIVSATSDTGVEFRMPGNPIKFSAYDDSNTRRPAPRHDQDRAEILASFMDD
jgi:CoA:oxalate CoA-transferase